MRKPVYKFYNKSIFKTETIFHAIAPNQTEQFDNIQLLPGDSRKNAILLRCSKTKHKSHRCNKWVSTCYRTEPWTNGRMTWDRDYLPFWKISSISWKLTSIEGTSITCKKLTYCGNSIPFEDKKRENLCATYGVSLYYKWTANSWEICPAFYFYKP